MEIYFYAGPPKEKNGGQRDKSLPPLPPVSRSLPNAIEEQMKEIQPKAPTFGDGMVTKSHKSKTSKHR